MITINTLSNEAFELDGVPFARIFQPIKISESNVGIINIYDTRQMILGATHYAEIELDGIVYTSLKELMIQMIARISPAV